MSESELKAALRSEAARADRFKGAQMLGAVVGLVVSLPFWSWSGWAGFLVWFGVAGIWQALSKDNPERAEKARAGKPSPLVPARFEYVDKGGPIETLTEARKLYSSLYRKKFDTADLDDVRAALDSFSEDYKATREGLNADIAWAKEQIKQAKADVANWSKAVVLAAAQSREQFEAQGKLDDAEEEMAAALDELREAENAKAAFAADLRPYVQGVIDAETHA